MRQQQQPPDLEEESGVRLSLTCEGSSNSNKFDVFISHRGPDTKRTMAIHMYDLLREKGIQAFLDKEELPSGERVWNAIEEAIEFSKVDVCILSRGYAESPWCLKEVEMMLHKYDMGKSKLIIVFYDVEPADVRHLKGAFGQGFKNLKEKGRHSNEVIHKWEQALRKIADIKGHEGQGELCHKIVDEVREKLDFALVAAPGMVGREKQLLSAINEIMRLREEGLGITSVEISGMGGIGKTTFAQNLYSRIYSKFDKHCFIENVNGLVEKGGIDAVHKQLVNELFRCSDTWKAEQYLRKRLHNMEILIILDNISSKNLSSIVFIEHDVCLSIKSTIVVTTREEGILKHEPKFAEYPQNLLSLRMSKLDFETSKQIFCEYAFGGMKHDSSEWNDLINSFVKKCDGIPLALAVHGRIVYGRDIQYWKIVWDKIKDLLHPDLMQTLKLSYDNLNDEISKRLFLDVATFLRFEKVDLLVQLQERYDANESEVLYAVDMLKRRLLIQVMDGILDMHDLLVDLGKSIVKEEDPCPGLRSRLWHANEVQNVLSGETGTKKVTALSLVSNGSVVLDECGDPWSAEAFSKLPSLEFLILDGSCIEGNDFSKLSKRLLWLKWTNFPYDHILETLCIKCVRVLQLSGERLTWLWEEPPAKLRELSLSNCKNLQRLPEFKERFLHLSCLELNGCTSLVTLPNSFGGLQGLKHLQLTDCNVLERLPDTIGDLRNLCNLNMSLERLKSLPESFGRLLQLKDLKMDGCGALQHLPKSFDNLSRLERLAIFGCEALQSLPESFGMLLQLKDFKMYRCDALQHLPKSFGNLSQLKWLQFECKALQSLPESFGMLLQLEGFEMYRCDALQHLPESFGNLSQLKRLQFDCKALQSLPESFGMLKKLKIFTLGKLGEFGGLSYGSLLQLESFKITSLLQLESFTIRSLKCLPKSFRRLQQIQELCIEDLFDITGLTENFGCFTNLLELRILHCTGMEELPESFGYLSQLQCLEIKHCSALKGLPESFGHLPQLQHLEIKHCSDLKGLPESFGHLPQLQHLVITDCSGLEGLPKSFGCLTKLVKLQVNGCHKLKLLAEQFQRLLRIHELSVTEIAYSSFGQNAAVEQQNIDYWKNSTWHGQDTQHQHLISLVHEVTRGIQAYSQHPAPPPFSDVELIANHFFQELPQSLGASQHINSLSLHHCHSLQKLPDIIGSLSGLTQLTLDSCFNLKVLPACIENLSQLENLTLISCWNLKELPDTIGNLKNLNVLYVGDCIVLKEFPFQSGSFSRLHHFKVAQCWMVQVIDIHAWVRLKCFVVSDCVNLRSIAGLSGLSTLEYIIIRGCLNLKDMVQRDINGCASWSSLKCLEINGCYQLRPPPEGLVRQPPHELEQLHLSLSHDIISTASLDNKTETMPASLINWSLNAKVQGFRSSRAVNAKTSPALFPVVEQRVRHLLRTKHGSSSSSTSSFSFHKFSQVRARSSSFPLGNANTKDTVCMLCFVSVVGTVDFPMHVPPPQTSFRMRVQDDFSKVVVQSASFDFGEEIHMVTFCGDFSWDTKGSRLYIEVEKGTDYWPSYEAIVKEGWMIVLPGRQGENKNKQNELLAAEILNIFYSELIKQRFMSRAWTQLPSQLRIFEFSALDIAGCQITKKSRHCNTCIMEEETGLTWERRRCLFMDDHALLLQHPRSSSKHSFLAYPGLHHNLEGGVLANFYEMSMCMLVKGKIVRSTKLQEIVGINQEEIPGGLNTLLQTKASLSTFETLHRQRSNMLHERYTRFSFSS